MSARNFIVVLVVVLFGLSFTWISANIGLRVPDVESAQAASFVWVFPFVFASSAFVRVDDMPGWLQGFAKNQPISFQVDGVIPGWTEALQKMKVNKAYFFSVGPNLSKYREVEKKDFDKNRMHEIRVDLGFRDRRRINLIGFTTRRLATCSM